MPKLFPLIPMLVLLAAPAGAVPPPAPGFSLGLITSTGSAPGTTDYVDSTIIKCFE